MGGMSRMALCTGGPWSCRYDGGLEVRGVVVVSFLAVSQSSDLDLRPFHDRGDCGGWYGE